MVSLLNVLGGNCQGEFSLCVKIFEKWAVPQCVSFSAPSLSCFETSGT